MGRPPSESVDGLELERLSLEREKLRFERQKLAVDAILKRRELAGRQNKSWKDLLANPLALAIVGGFITVMTTIVTTSYTATENRTAENLRAGYARDSAKQALQAELIKKFVETPKIETARDNLQFLVDAGLLPDYAKDIAAYLKNNPKAGPTVATSTSLGDVGGTFDTRAPALVRQLISDFGFADFQAAAIVGNIGHETAGFRHLQEIMPVSGGRGGFGYLQWTGARRANFEKFCQDRNLEPASAEANYAFMKHELQTTENKAVVAVKAATSIEQATQDFEQNALRVSVKNYESRIRWARRALALSQSP
jgi:hypothetical protein